MQTPTLSNHLYNTAIYSLNSLRNGKVNAVSGSSSTNLLQWNHILMHCNTFLKCNFRTHADNNCQDILTDSWSLLSHYLFEDAWTQAFQVSKVATCFEIMAFEDKVRHLMSKALRQLLSLPGALRSYHPKWFKLVSYPWPRGKLEGAG